MYDGRAAHHVRRFPRPSPSVFAYWKRSKAGGVEGLGTRLNTAYSTGFLFLYPVVSDTAA